MKPITRWTAYGCYIWSMISQTVGEGDGWFTIEDLAYQCNVKVTANFRRHINEMVNTDRLMVKPASPYSDNRRKFYAARPPVEVIPF